jgi:hypothetical protein
VESRGSSFLELLGQESGLLEQGFALGRELGSRSRPEQPGKPPGQLVRLEAACFVDQEREIPAAVDADLAADDVQDGAGGRALGPVRLNSVP